MKSPVIWGFFIAFLGASLGVKYGTHFSMDLVYEKVSSDSFRHGLKVFINVISAIIMFVIGWYGWEQTMKLRQFGVVTPVLQLPKYGFICRYLCFRSLRELDFLTWPAATFLS